MKKLTYIIAIATSVLAMASCQKEQNVTNSDDLTVVSFSTSEIQTKTAFGDKTADGKYPTLWTGNEIVGVAYNSGSINKENITSSTDGKSASFEIAFAQDANATSHNFYVISPADAFLGMNKDGAKGHIKIETTQTPGEGTCDPAAQVIAASHKSETFDTQVNLAFSHVTAYGNLSIILPENAGAVSKISLTSSKNIAGRFYYDFNGSLEESTASATISLLTSKVSDIFFACAPADLSSGKLDITVTTENGTYEKSIDLTGKPLKFESGKISKFTVTGFAKKESDEIYTLVTNVSTLKIGDKVIIAAANANVAISTTQNTSNRPQADVTKKDNTIVNPGKDVQLFTLEPGTVANTYAFNTGSGYIYAASSKYNVLKTQQTNNNNGSWTITCTATGTATIKANGTNSRNLLKYNSNTTSGKIFSCYSSGQSDVAIYSDGKGTGSVPTPPAIKAESTSVSLNHDDETDHYMTVTITGAEADDISCNVAENADGTGETPAWLTANYPDKDGKLSYRAKANTTNAARTAYIVLSASNADGTTSLAIKVTQNGVGGAESTLVWDDDFSSLTKANTTALKSLNGSKTGFKDAYTIENCYPEVSSIKMSSGKTIGSLQTPKFTKLSGSSSVVVTVEYAGYGKDGGTLNLSVVGNGTLSVESLTATNTATNGADVKTWDKATFVISGADKSTALKLTASAKGKRFFINSIKIEIN